jgi:hypothetical protein
MYKNISSSVLLNKPESFGIVKPFHCAFCHFPLLLAVRDSNPYEYAEPLKSFKHQDAVFRVNTKKSLLDHSHRVQTEKPHASPGEIVRHSFRNS